MWHLAFIDCKLAFLLIDFFQLTIEILVYLSFTDDSQSADVSAVKVNNFLHKSCRYHLENFV